jgi:hypothetical protein
VVHEQALHGVLETKSASGGEMAGSGGGGVGVGALAGIVGFVAVAALSLLVLVRRQQVDTGGSQLHFWSASEQHGASPVLQGAAVVAGSEFGLPILPQKGSQSL